MASTAASYRNSQPAQSTDPGELLKLSEDLMQLIREGLVVSFEDERGVTRYRTIALGKAA